MSIVHHKYDVNWECIQTRSKITLNFFTFNIFGRVRSECFFFSRTDEEKWQGRTVGQIEWANVVYSQFRLFCSTFFLGCAFCCIWPIFLTKLSILMHSKEIECRKIFMFNFFLLMYASQSIECMERVGVYFFWSNKGFKFTYSKFNLQIKDGHLC